MSRVNLLLLKVGVVVGTPRIGIIIRSSRTVGVSGGDLVDAELAAVGVDPPCLPTRELRNGF